MRSLNLEKNCYKPRNGHFLAYFNKSNICFALLFLSFFVSFSCDRKSGRNERNFEKQKTNLNLSLLQPLPFLMDCLCWALLLAMDWVKSLMAILIFPGHWNKQGGFQSEFVSISRVINHITCYKFECSHWWKIYSFTRFALQKCCNFNQWEDLIFSRSCDLQLSLYVLTNFNWKPPKWCFSWPNVWNPIHMQCLLYPTFDSCTLHCSLP